MIDDDDDDDDDDDVSRQSRIRDDYVSPASQIRVAVATATTSTEACLSRHGWTLEGSLIFTVPQDLRPSGGAVYRWSMIFTVPSELCSARRDSRCQRLFKVLSFLSKDLSWVEYI